MMSRNYCQIQWHIIRDHSVQQYARNIQHKVTNTAISKVITEGLHQLQLNSSVN